MTETRKTMAGRSAYNWLRKATVAPARAGNVEIWVADGTTAMRTQDGDLLLATSGGVIGRLVMTPRASAMMDKLMDQADTMQREELARG